jgi:hypothetical protein
MKILLLVTASLLIGAGGTHYITQKWQLDENVRQYKAAQEDVMNALIEAEAGVTAGVTREKWSEHVRNTSIRINKFKLLKSPDLKEMFALSDVMRSMQATADVWRERETCQYKTQDEGCLEQLARVLYSVGYPLANQTNDANRLIIKLDNANFNEYFLAYKAELLKENIKGYDTTGVARLLSNSSQQIKKYFLLHGIFL